MEIPTTQYSVTVALEPIKLPPVTDVLVLAKRHPQGKVGIMESFRFMAPDEFEFVDIDDPSVVVEAVLINRSILKRLPLEKVLEILERLVFPRVSEGEAVKVSFSTRLTFGPIEGELTP